MENTFKVDPDNLDALMEAMQTPVKEQKTKLELLNGFVIDPVIYIPQSLGASLEFDNGTPVSTNTRKPKFEYRKWAKEVLPKINELALQNIKIVDDIGKEITIGKGEVRLSLIGPGEFRKLQDLCFPGTSDTEDFTDEDSAPPRKSGKGARGRKPDAPSPAV